MQHEKKLQKGEFTVVFECGQVGAFTIVLYHEPHDYGTQ